MTLCNQNCRISCAFTAVIAGIITGVIAAFLQITGLLVITPIFLWVVFGIAIVYLAILIGAAALTGGTDSGSCACSALRALLIGILGTILLAGILLAVGVAAVSVISAILVGLLLFFFTLALVSAACFIRCLFNCAT